MVIHLVPKQPNNNTSTSEENLRSCPVCGHAAWDGGIIKTCLSCFGKGLCVYVVRYPPRDNLVAFTLRVDPINPYPPEQVVQRAVNLFQRKTFGNYNVVFNNCEHFATFCKLGVGYSTQTTPPLI